MLIAVAGLKGGVGRTMVAVALAAESHQRGHDTLLVDLSPQRCASEWLRRAGARAPGGLALRDPAELASAAHGRHTAVVDLPSDLEVTLDVLVQAELVVLPTNPIGIEVHGLERTLALVEYARRFNPSLDARVLLNRVDTRRGGRQRLARRLDEQGWPVLGTILSERVAFADALACGLHVGHALEGSHEANEVLALHDEITHLNRSITSPMWIH